MLHTREGTQCKGNIGGGQIEEDETNIMDEKETVEPKKISKESSFRERVRRYCQWTSLHGFNFLAYPGQTITQTGFWLVIVIASIVGAFVVVGTNIRDFADSSVSYDLATPTQPLDEVFFPSLVLCNMNQLRSSFIWALVNDPALKVRNSTYLEVHQLLEKTFVKVL